MDFEYLFLVISFSASIFSALFCLVLITLKVYDHSLDFFTKRLSIALMSFYIVSIIFFVTIFFYVFDLKLYWWFKGLNFQSVLLLPIIFYHIVFKLSRLKKDEKFSYYHYVICFLIGISYIIYSRVMPHTPLVPGNEINLKNALFFDDGRIITRIIYNTVYLSLALYRLLRYRKHISNYSSDTSQNSLTWMYNILLISILIYPGPILFYLIPDMKNSLLFGQLIPNFLFMFFNISLCYNIFSQNFNLVYEDIILDSDEVETKKYKEVVIDKATFEQYLFTEKPFLNPQLKITDLLPDLMTNRTYLSSFINTTYQMNFSQFINKCRFKEYLDLKETLDQSNLNEVDIILASGFRSYESFKRTESHYYKTMMSGEVYSNT
ncbi:hypothetical protein [Myroides odoratus]|uniref:hypothetical protein n=1 Tax=Myroides odoratus TaxID=256 RepID=UPI000765C18F|nr:hypothetical protein [Myroides odoratus]